MSTWRSEGFDDCETPLPIYTCAESERIREVPTLSGGVLYHQDKNHQMGQMQHWAAGC